MKAMKTFAALLALAFSLAGCGAVDGDPVRPAPGSAGQGSSTAASGADSAGKQWGYMLPSIYYDLGISIQDVLDSLVNNGLCDWRTNARQLLLWNADSVAVCRDLSKSCVVTLAQDVSEAPDDESIDGLASSILVRGDNINFRQDNPNAPKPWGGWELYSSQQGVNKKETADVG